MSTGQVILLIVEAVILIGIFKLNEDHRIGLKCGLASVTLTIVGILAYNAFDFDFITPIAENPIISILLASSYFAVGAMYSIARWFYFVRRKSIHFRNEQRRCFAEHNHRRDAALAEHKIEAKRRGEEPSKEFLLWWDRNNPRSTHYIQALRENLMPKNNKGRITGWIVLWPVDWAVDLLRDVVIAVYEWCSGIYQRITNKALQDL